MDIQADVTLVTGIVDNLLDEQSLQDERILTLEQDSRELLEDVEGKEWTIHILTNQEDIFVVLYPD